MKSLSASLAALLSIALLSGCAASKKLKTQENDLVQYSGRVGLSDSGVTAIYWPGSSATTTFRGTMVTATLKDQRGHNYFNVIIDKDSVYPLKLDTLKKTYTLASGLPDGVHTIEISRRGDWNDGVVWFYGFGYDKDAAILKPAPKKRMIEFYGNSITVGAAIEDFGGDRGGGLYTNNYLSYGALTARHYNARFSCIARSGIGLMVSWFQMIMPEMYYRLNPFDSASRWDFSKDVPDIVVINLLQNDNTLVNMPDYDQFKYRFGATPPSEETIVNAYKRFVSQIRTHYPQAHIICALGSMDATRPGSPWPGYIKKAVGSMNDQKIYTYFFDYIHKNWHPKVEDHKKMSDNLIRFIDENIKW